MPGLSRFASLAVPVAMAATSFSALAQHSTPAIDTPRKEVIERIVRDYIRTHPEIVVEALAADKSRKDEAKRAAQASIVTGRADEIFRSPSSPVIGNVHGDITLVAFFDYQCGYCKRAQSDVERLMKEDVGIKVVMKEFPVLGPASERSARAALAAYRQGKYPELHARLMGFQGKLSEDVTFEIARQVELDLDRLKQDMNDPSVTAELRANRQLAKALGITGTPAVVINNQIIPDAVGFDALKNAIKQKAQ